MATHDIVLIGAGGIAIVRDPGEAFAPSRSEAHVLPDQNVEGPLDDVELQTARTQSD